MYVLPHHAFSQHLHSARHASIAWQTCAHRLDGRYALPAWRDHVEKGETPHQAALPELHEELGVAVEPQGLAFLCVAARNTSPTEYVAYEFVIRDKLYDFHNAEPEKCSELIWAETTALPTDVIEHFQQIVEQAVIGERTYLEVGF